ncbi:zinc-binding alcohol dehydrogenase family protein [Herbiconiux daphne]|uniref:Zinc-type alcohol dehydrogenase-like protein n=1 Tax=Herbiconiux daphne TaxID=2970914 RepID=A0ABT2H541_9MICO|nr:zinc-binding alcohol dehydrogenase family protein [Herbiconiux daphne]MCS5735070.1 zinc-binding alcohol dehydrogenase family protein [Herbiconiux daphne]
MRAIAAAGPGGRLIDVEVPRPALREHDALVAVEAVSINPADVKLAERTTSRSRILGFDAVGTVIELGPSATGFAVGDEVYYAGDITRQGANADYHAVDTRLIAHRPMSLTVAEAAALPLTTITAWESLFTHLSVNRETTGDLVVVGAAGGVGSMVIQLAKLSTALRVVGTASRPESEAWAAKMGADELVDPRDLVKGVKSIAPLGVDAVFSSYSSGNIRHFAEILKPFGHIVAIDDGHLDLSPLKAKSITWHWEYMFTHSTQKTPQMSSQGELLRGVASLVDAGMLRSTLTTEIQDFTAAGIQRAHDLVATSTTVGKVVVRR